MLSLALVVSGLLLDPQDGDPLYSSTPSSLVEGHEVIMIEATFAPGQEVPLHYHPGEEIAHIVAGEIILYRDGMDPLTIGAGQSVSIAPGLHHWAKAGADGADAMIVRIHPIGQELTIPVVGEKG